MEKMSQRSIYIDYIKALGLILVILYHCQYVPFDSMFIHGIYAICVPLFFMVNGYLMLCKERSIHALLKKNLKILIVMLFWALVSTAVYMWTNGEWSANNLMGGGKSFILNSLLINKPYCNHLWFLKSIFILNLFNPIIYSFIHRNDKRLKYLLLLLVLFTVRFIDIIVCRFSNPMLGWMTGFSVLYYVLGYALLDGHLATNKIRTSWVVVLVIVAALLQWGYNWLFLSGPLCVLNAQKMWVNDIVWDGYNAPFIVLLTAAICLLFQRIPWKGCRWLLFVGANSLAIYVMQTPIQRIWQAVLPLNEWTAHYSICGAILPVFTLGTCMLITYGMLKNKYTKYFITI